MYFLLFNKKIINIIEENKAKKFETKYQDIIIDKSKNIFDFITSGDLVKIGNVASVVYEYKKKLYINLNYTFELVEILDYIEEIFKKDENGIYKSSWKKRKKEVI